MAAYLTNIYENNTHIYHDISLRICQVFQGFDFSSGRAGFFFSHFLRKAVILKCDFHKGSYCSFLMIFCDVLEFFLVGEVLGRVIVRIKRRYYSPGTSFTKLVERMWLIHTLGSNIILKFLLSRSKLCLTYLHIALGHQHFWGIFL